MDFTIGQKVKIIGEVQSFVLTPNEDIPDTVDFIAQSGLLKKRGQNYRALMRTYYPTPIEGMILGYSTRKTGWVYSPSHSADSMDGPGDYDPGGIVADATYTVWIVMPTTPGRNRYRTPVAAFGHQLRSLDWSPVFEPIG